MDAGTVTDPVLELCLRHAREQRDEITLWLAVQVLMTDDVALADDALQDRLENMMRTRHGLPDRDAPVRNGDAKDEDSSEPERSAR